MKQGITDVRQRMGFALTTAVRYFGTTKERKFEKKRATRGYVTSELDRLDEIGATEKLKKAERTGIMNEIRKHPKETSLFLECVHTFNRIAAGIHDKTLDEVIIFQTWPPRWFERQWEILEDLIRREEEEQRELKESYRYFEWLATRRCPEVRDKYPEFTNED